MTSAAKKESRLSFSLELKESDVFGSQQKVSHQFEDEITDPHFEMRMQDFVSPLLRSHRALTCALD